MPIVSIKEFADLCSKESKDIHVYIGRGKVVKHKSGGIDTNNIINKMFLDKFNGIYVEPEKPKIIKQEPVKEVEKIEIIPKKKEKKLPKEKEECESEQKFVSAAELNDLKAEKLEQEILQLKLKNQRLEGELIEFELVQQTAFEVINAYRTTTYIAAENVLKNNMKDLGANNDKLTKAVSDLSTLFNLASSEAIDNVKQMFEKLI